MSSSSLVQGLHSCVEPRLAHGYKLPRWSGDWLASLPDPDPVWESKNGDRSSNFPAKDSKGEKSGAEWSSITESIYSPSQNLVPDSRAESSKRQPAPTFANSAQTWSFYSPVPSVPRFNQRSLDLCTEILGSETGKGYPIGEEDDFSNLFSAPTPRTLPLSSKERSVGTERKLWTSREVSSTGGLPPPLPSIAGGKTVRVVRCNEGGRLVLKTTTEPSSLIYQSQRTIYRSSDENGGSHLCIHYVNGSSPSTHFLKRYHPISPRQGKEEGGEEAVEEEEGEVDEEEIGEELGIVGKEMEMERSNGEEVGVEKFWRRPSRCKEGGGGSAGGGGCGGGGNETATGRVLLNWVATS